MVAERAKLTDNERILLINQFLILEKLYPERSSEFEELRAIAEKGFELHYKELYHGLSNRGLSETECREVMDILDMYRALKDSYDRLDDKSGIEEADVQFPGFDGNNVYEYLSYADFLIRVQGRWQEVLDGRPNFELNSHSNNLEMLRRMLAEWKKIDKRYRLSKDDTKQILAAMIHPENR